MLELGSLFTIDRHTRARKATASRVPPGERRQRVTTLRLKARLRLPLVAATAITAFACVSPLSDARADEPPVRASIMGATESHLAAEGHVSPPAAAQSDTRSLILAPPSDPRAAGSRRQSDTSSFRSRLRRSSPWWTAGSLCIVLALFVIAARLLRHRLPLTTPSIPKEVLEPLGRCQLDAKQSVHLVRCGSQILVLGSSGAGLCSLGAITDREEVDRMAGQCRHTRRASAGEAFSSVFTRHARTESRGSLGSPTRGHSHPQAVDLEALEEAGEANHV